MSIKRSAKEYFTFNRREKRAVLILSSLIVLLAIAPQLYLYVHSDDKVDDKVFEAGVKIIMPVKSILNLKTKTITMK